jgi:hypothetical protein
MHRVTRAIPHTSGDRLGYTSRGKAEPTAGDRGSRNIRDLERAGDAGMSLTGRGAS